MKAPYIPNVNDEKLTEGQYFNEYIKEYLQHIMSNSIEDDRIENRNVYEDDIKILNDWLKSF